MSSRLPTSDPLSWDEARVVFGLGDRGTPGTVNTLQARHYLLSGTLVTMDESLPASERVFSGTVHIQGNRILAVLHAADPPPPDAAGAFVVDTRALIFPGLMNIHNHIAFNTIPAWDVPALMQDVSDWTSLNAYRQNVRYPHEILTDLNYYDLLPEFGKYAEVKALAAGTTAEQGSFPISPGFTGHLARNVDLENFGADRIRQRALSVLDSNFLGLRRLPLSSPTWNGLKCDMPQGCAGRREVMALSPPGVMMCAPRGSRTWLASRASRSAGLWPEPGRRLRCGEPVPGGRRTRHRGGP